jgi:hypothetical protein
MEILKHVFLDGKHIHNVNLNQVPETLIKNKDKPSGPGAELARRRP